MAEKATITTSKNYVYNIYDNGDISRTSIKHPDVEKSLSKHKDCGGVYVWIDKSKFYIKWLVAKHFMKGTGQAIEHIDSDEENCSVGNLRFAKRDMSKDRRTNTKVLVDGVEYGSMAAAERFLNVSQGYLTRYFKGQLSGKALGEHKVELAEG